MSPSPYILQFLLSKYKNKEASASGSQAGRHSVSESGGSVSPSTLLSTFTLLN